MLQELPNILIAAALATILMFALFVGMLLYARRITERTVQVRQPPLPNVPDGSAKAVPSKVMRCRLLLVHGTWGQRSPFLAKNSPFQQAMRNGLPGLRGDIEVFQWSGRLWQSRRNQAAKDLFERLTGALETLAADENLVVIAHSHGGTVTAQAMRQLGRELNPAQLARIRVISFGTPYILYTFHPVSMLAVFIWSSLLALAGTSWLLALGAGEGLTTLGHIPGWYAERPMQLLIAFAVSVVLGGILTAWFVGKRAKAEKALGRDSGYPASSRLLYQWEIASTFYARQSIHADFCIRS